MKPKQSATALLAAGLFVGCTIAHYELRPRRAAVAPIAAPENTPENTPAKGPDSSCTTSFALAFHDEGLRAPASWEAESRYVAATKQVLRARGCAYHHVADADSASLVIDIVRRRYETLPQEWLTGLSFGLIPSWGTREAMQVISVRDKAARKSHAYMVDNKSYNHLFLAPVSWVTLLTMNDDKVYRKALVDFLDSPRLPSDEAATAREATVGSPAAETGGEGAAALPPTSGALLTDAVIEGDTVAARILLDEGGDPDLAHGGGISLLMLAALRGDTAMTRLLLAAEARVDARDTKGATALMYAARNGRTATVALLLDAGADIGLKDSGARNAMDHARARGSRGVLALLEGAADEVYDQEATRSALPPPGASEILIFLEGTSGSLVADIGIQKKVYDGLHAGVSASLGAARDGRAAAFVVGFGMPVFQVLALNAAWRLDAGAAVDLLEMHVAKDDSGKTVSRLASGITPQLRLHRRILPGLNLILGVGYGIPWYMGSWAAEGANGTEIPARWKGLASDANANGFTVSLGISRFTF